MKLYVEGCGEILSATPSDISHAVLQMWRPKGPTFMIIEDDDGNYAQAAGTDERYVIESRYVFGEGFQHFRVCQPIAGPDGPDVVYHRQKCSRHPPRRCPLTVRRSEVCDIDTVSIAMSAYVTTGERCASLQWRDVTQESLEEASRRRGDDEITPIGPGPR
jgi:hypothetical protein